MSTSGLEYAQHVLDEARYLIERTSGVSKATFSERVTADLRQPSMRQRAQP